MDALGLLKIRVRRGINLAVRDTVSSDPYVVISSGTQVCLSRIPDMYMYTFSISFHVYILKINL